MAILIIIFAEFTLFLVLMCSYAGSEFFHCMLFTASCIQLDDITRVGISKIEKCLFFVFTPFVL